MNWRLLLAVFSLAPLAPLAMSASPTCSDLSGLFLPDTTITSAVDVPAGPYIPYGEDKATNVPAFCHVRAVSRPGSDSEIHFEIWLPAAAAWNGKFQGTGNGGFSSTKNYRGMAIALNQGYATA